MTNPRLECILVNNEVHVPFPFPETFKCPFCYREGAALQKGSGAYQRHEDLGKHLRLRHHGVTRRFVCSRCAFTDDSAYAIKKVKAHFAAAHPGSASPRASGARPSPIAGSSHRKEKEKEREKENEKEMDESINHSNNENGNPAGGDQIEERSPCLDEASAELTRRAPSPLVTAQPTTRGGVASRHTTTQPAKTRNTVAAGKKGTATKKTATTRTVTGKSTLLTSWATSKATTAARRSGTPSSPAEGRPSAAASPATPPVTATPGLPTAGRTSAGRTSITPAGTGAASGGSASMGGSRGSTPTSSTPPIIATTRKSPGAGRRSTRASTEPPQPDPPLRTFTSKRTTPAVTYAEVTKGQTAATTTMTTRRMTRAMSLPPVSEAKKKGGASTSTAPPTSTLAATCTFATAGTLTLTSTSVCSRPVAAIAVTTERGGGGKTSPRGPKKQVDVTFLESAPVTRSRAARAATEPPRTSPRTRRGVGGGTPPEKVTVSEEATTQTEKERPETRRSARAMTLPPGLENKKSSPPPTNRGGEEGDANSSQASPGMGRSRKRELLPVIAESSPVVIAAPEQEKEVKEEMEKRKEEESRDFTPLSTRRMAGRQEATVEGLTTPLPRTPERQPRIEERGPGGEEELIRAPRIK
ncbi:uncharacterized protein LOC143266198 [Megachile rotundata]|uniref:uncharacterized protein LOC143266198 n=1 Tax=Megachile rotundata TaxID=143995 RepID=UPI003FCFD16C